MNKNKVDNYRVEKISILISDLRGFTHFSETLSPAEVLSLLNRYFNIMIPIIEKYNGVVDKITGASIVGLFRYKNDDINNVLACSIEMQNSMQEINKENNKLGFSSVYMGVGINTGVVATGFMGNASPHEYTAIGNEVNIASRVESFSMRGQVLISDNSYQICKENVQIGRTYNVHPKGVVRPLKIYELLKLKKPQAPELQSNNARREPRIKIKLPVHFQLISDKMVHSEIYEGETTNISCNGLSLKTKKKLKNLNKIFIEVSSSIFGEEVGSAYARIKHLKHGDEYYTFGLEFTAIDDQALEVIKAFIDNSI